MIDPPPSAAPSNLRRPRVIFWYRLYCVFMCLICTALATFGLVIVIDPDLFFAGAFGTPTMSALIGSIYLFQGVLPGLMFALTFFVPRTRWGYVVHLAAIGSANLMGILCLPMSLPLLLFWVRPEVQEYFGWKPGTC